MRRVILSALAAGAATVLAACGSATVDNEGPTSVAPLERESAEASTEESSSESTSSEADSESSEGGSEQAAQDRGAREVSAIPEPEEETDTPDAKFLGALSDAGLDTDGVEYQVISAAQGSCESESNVIVQAVAGQLIEQGRTDMPFEELTGLLEDQARTAYC